jgi:uncharacterized membrane protein
MKEEKTRRDEVKLEKKKIFIYFVLGMILFYGPLFVLTIQSFAYTRNLFSFVLPLVIAITTIAITSFLVSHVLLEIKNKEFKSKIWFGKLIGVLLSGAWVFKLAISNTLGTLLKNFLIVLVPITILVVIGSLVDYFIKKKRWVSLGLFVGGATGFTSAWWIQLTNSFGEWYLGLFGTYLQGGNWHLLVYAPLFGVVWASISGLIVFIIKVLVKGTR